jgi:hypothetical protein
MVSDSRAQTWSALDEADGSECVGLSTSELITRLKNSGAGLVNVVDERQQR